MTKKYFGISKPLMKELFKMYWYVPVLSFVLYFFTGIFPILVNIRKLADVEIEYYVSLLMSNQNLAYMGLLTLIPLVSAVLMMSFIHNEAKALALHSQPISKGRLFDTRYLGGLIICILPVIVNAVIYLCICSFKNVTYEYGILGASGIMSWALSSVAIMVFLYGIYMLAGALTGTTTMHILTSGILFAIFPIVIVTITSYFNIFLHGWYETPDWVYDLTWSINPIGKLLMRYGAISPVQSMFYILMGILMYLGSKLIYSTRKLELIGTSMLSKTFEKFLTYIVVFMGMCIFGFIVLSFSEAKWFIVMGMTLGILFTFAVLKIVLNRSFKCFERSMAKSLAVCFVIGAVFMAFTIFDAGGYSKEIPHAEDIESVEINGLILGYDLGGYISGEVPEEYYDPQQVLVTEDSIESVRNLHQYIVDEKLYTEREDAGASVYSCSGEEVISTVETVNIVYNLKDGGVLKRRYNIYLTSEAVKLIDGVVSGEEYREKIKLENRLKLNKIKRIEFESYETGENAEGVESKIVITDPRTIKGLIRAMDRDIISYGYESNNPGYVSCVADMKIFFLMEEGVNSGSGSITENSIANDKNISDKLEMNIKEETLSEEENFLWLDIRESDAFVISFLEEKGLIKPGSYQ